MRSFLKKQRGFAALNKTQTAAKNMTSAQLCYTESLKVAATPAFKTYGESQPEQTCEALIAIQGTYTSQSQENRGLCNSLSSLVSDLESGRRIYDEFMVKKQEKDSAADTYQKKKDATQKVKSSLSKLATNDARKASLEAVLATCEQEEATAKEDMEKLSANFDSEQEQYQKDLISALCTPLSDLAMKASKAAQKISELSDTIESSANSFCMEEDPTMARLSKVLETIENQLSTLRGDMEAPAEETPVTPATDNNRDELMA